jgi:hypothetical protein
MHSEHHRPDDGIENLLQQAYEVVQQSNLLRLASLQEYSTEYREVIHTASDLSDTIKSISEQLASILPVDDLSAKDTTSKGNFLQSRLGQGFTLHDAKPARLLYDATVKDDSSKKEWIFVLPIEGAVLRTNYTEWGPPEAEVRLSTVDHSSFWLTEFTPPLKDKILTPSTILTPARIMSHDQICRASGKDSLHLLNTHGQEKIDRYSPEYNSHAQRMLSLAASKIYIGLHTMLKQNY